MTFIQNSCGILFAVFASLLSGPSPASDLALVDVAVVDVETGEVRAGQTVFIRNGRIRSVGRSQDLSVPGETPVVTGSGKFLIPGLWDMHVHLSTDSATREILFPLFIAHGVTGVRVMGVDCFEEGPPDCIDPDLADPLPSIETVRSWRSEMEDGTLVGPRVVAGSFNLHGPGEGERSSPVHPGTPAHARAHVAVLQERGVDFAKVYTMFPRNAYFALLDEAGKRGLPVAGHVPLEVSAFEASRAGQASIEHIGPGHELVECTPHEERLRAEFIAQLGSPDPRVLPLLIETAETYDSEACRELFHVYRDNGTWVTPTLVLAPTIEAGRLSWRRDPRGRFLPEVERRYWETWGRIFDEIIGTDAQRLEHSRWVRRVAREMHEAGVRFLAGTDSGYPGIYWGSTLHEELRLLVEAAGLTNAQALRAATVSAAEFLGQPRTGAIEPGNFADLVLLAGNPLEDIGSTLDIDGVVTRGRWLDRRALDELLEAAEKAARRSRDGR